MAKTVRINSLYAYQPKGDFKWDTVDIEVGTIVRVISKSDSSTAHKLGYCYIEHQDGEAIEGLVLCDSLQRVTKKGMKYFLEEE